MAFNETYQVPHYHYQSAKYSVNVEVSQDLDEIHQLPHCHCPVRLVPSESQQLRTSTRSVINTSGHPIVYDLLEH